jgi:hypothetical protein
VSIKTKRSYIFAGVALAAAAHSAKAQITVFTDLASFQAAAPSATVKSTFEGFSTGEVGDITDGGLSFANNGGGPLYILDPSTGGTSPAPQSKILTANGNERFDITFGATTPTAVGFQTYTNSFAPPVVSFFNAANAQIGSVTLSQGPDTLGFLGVTSTVPIARVL